MDENSEIRPVLLSTIAQPCGPGERRRVLVVDDEPGMRYMARRALERNFEVTEAASGEEALRLLESESYHIAIIDVRLPGISGLDLLVAFKACCPSIDVIVMTGSAADTDEALEWSIRRKAFFFLRKPFAVSVLETLVERVAETQQLEERLVGYARTLEKALESARIFQRRLLPSRLWSGPGIRIASQYRESERLSGDFFDYWPLASGGTGILVADVMGHGPSAAMVTGIVKSQLRSLSDQEIEPGELLTALEEELVRIALPGFLTALLVFDLPDRGVIAYAGAGHPPGLLLVPERSGAAPGPDPELDAVVSMGIPLNTGLPIVRRETATLPRVPGSRLLLYTDGYPEATSPSGEIFDGLDGITAGESVRGARVRRTGTMVSPFARAALAALQAAGPEQGIHTMDATWAEFTGGRPPEDDLAAVLAFLT